MQNFLRTLSILLLSIILCVPAGAQPTRDNRPRSTARLQKSAIDDYWHYHSAGNLGLTVTNYGVIGEGYNNVNQPSCMYKLHADNARDQIEHMSFGGLWVGGRGGPDGMVHVSTAIVDGVFEAGEEGFEFTNTASAGDTIRVRSTIVTSPYFSPEAISHQDFVSTFSDLNTRVPGTDFEIPNHTPLGLSVTLESYAWNYPYTDAFVILNYTLTNVSRYRISELYAGIWADAAVGNMNYTSIYVSGGGWSWYDNFNGFDQDYDMAYQFDADGDDGFAESYFGLRYLGSSRRQDSVQVNYDQWRWSSSSTLDFPEYVMPLTDEGRYEVLRGRHTGKYYNDVTNGGIPTDLANRGSWMLVLGAGSLGDLEPGASAQITFAIVCGLWATRDAADSPARRANLRLNSEWAKIAYNGEDVDGDGKLDPDEDVNRNGILDGEEDLYRTELDLNGNRRWDAGEPIFGDGDGVLDIEEDVYTNALKGIVAGNGVIDRFILPSPPPSPNLLLMPGEGEVTLFWDNVPELYEDPITREIDFEGYRVYSSPKTAGSMEESTLLAEFDRINGLNYDTGFTAVRTDTVIDGHRYHYRFTNRDLLSGWPGEYWFAVTAFDRGNPKNRLPSLESSVLENKTYAIVGSPARKAGSSLPVGVFPNPYRGQAIWDGDSDRQQMLWFFNLPAEAEVRIYTLAGDVVDEFIHHGATYKGEDVELMQQRIGGSNTVLPGGLHAWDLISAFDQAIATGLYFFSVKDLQSGEIQTGKFVVIK
ncbi:MAG TPA: hypothetical protein PKI81_00870 [bacterium]|nr:hypothetical protein [bacterium]HOZ21879.1 hypothetical protein [bacterium]